MKTVFNLTGDYLDYRKKTIPPYGSMSFDLDFIPDRDLALAKAGVIAIGSLPPGWVRPSTKVEPVQEVVKLRIGTPILDVAELILKQGEIAAKVEAEKPVVEKVIEKSEKHDKKK